MTTKMTIADIIEEPHQEVFTNEELSRRIVLLQDVCERLAERLQAVDGMGLAKIATTSGWGVGAYPCGGASSA